MGDTRDSQARVYAQTQTSTPLMFGASDRIELIATIVLAVATVLTAWSAFQGAKWGGKQSIFFAEASAARTSSVQAALEAGQLRQVDASMYIDWVSAYDRDLLTGGIPEPDGIYEPTTGTLSGFLYGQFSSELKSAVDAWTATDPLTTPDAPLNPFVMVDEGGEPVYKLAEEQEAADLTAVAEERAQQARGANQNSDNYIIMMVVFASVMFFAGVSSKLESPLNRKVVLGLGVFVLIVGAVILASLPMLTLRG